MWVRYSMVQLTATVTAKDSYLMDKNEDKRRDGSHT